MLIQTESGEYDDGTMDDVTFKDYVIQNFSDPNAVANFAKQYNYGLKDVSRATGFGETDVSGFFNNAQVTPWWSTAAPVTTPTVVAPTPAPTGGITNVATTVPAVARKFR